MASAAPGCLSHSATATVHSKPIVADLQAFGYNAGGGGRTGQDRFPRHLADVNHDGAADIIGFGYDGVYEALSSAFHLTEIGHHRESCYR